MKKKKNNFPKYLFGGKTTDDLLSDYLANQQKRSSENPSNIQNPNQALNENNMAMARAEQEASSNPWTQGLDIFGNLAMQVGGSMMSKGISEGEGVSEGGFDWGSMLQGGINNIGAMGNASSQGMATGGKVKKRKGVASKINKGTGAGDINMEIFRELMMGKNKTMVAANGGIVDPTDPKKKGTTKVVKRDLTAKEIAAQVALENKKDIFAEGETVFNAEGIDTLFGNQDEIFTPTSQSNLDLGKYKSVGYFDVVQDTQGRYTLKNTTKNPANPDLYKQQADYIRRRNPNLNIAKDSSGYTPLSELNNSFATGGVANGVPVEAEGDEIVQTPDGQMEELDGPSHEQGGIELLLPEGTEIFSKRLKGEDGKTMADRKKSRERQAKKLQKLYDASPSDMTLKKTLEKTTANNEKEEANDLAIMEEARLSYNSGMERMMGGMIESMAKGGTVYDNGGITEMQGAEIDVSDAMAEIQQRIDMNNRQVPNTGGSFNISDIFGGGEGLTLGDGIGLAGNAVSTFGPMKNTRANRAGDTPNINAFEDFGQEGLEALDKSKQYVGGQRDNNLQDLELARSSAIKRGRNSARGVNTQRALDIASSASVNDTKSKVYNNFAQQMQRILEQQAGMENQQDQVVMSGEQNKDLADRQDRDNFFTQLAQDISTKGTGLQHMGKNINSAKERETMSQVLEDLFENYAVNSRTGKTKFKKNK